MSPVSRGRKAKKNKKPASRFATVGPVEPCDCPACSGHDLDLPGLVDQLLADVDDLDETADPLDVEILAATFVAICELAGEGFESALAEGFIPEIEARATGPALVLLRALGSVADGRAGKAASIAADRLTGAGVPLPGWATELAEPVSAGDCWRLVDSADTASMLICSLHRAGRAHTAIVSVDHGACGAATDIMLFDAAELPQAMAQIQAQARETGLEIRKESLAPAEFRWQVEDALDARAAHDATVPPSYEALSEYGALAALLRVRMSALPASGKPKATHRDTFAAPRSLPRLLGSPTRRKPPKRKAPSGPARVYQLKVTLRGAKPPIWRRLEVPADVSLARLHTVLQAAFGWDDSHLHVFETPYGEFGHPDPELGHQPEAKVTLEQVLPGERDKITYTYDFGDDWHHDILVEKLLDPDQAASYPRCTGGRRAGPPEDCGGVWGYAELVDVLADPTHPEHDERLDWLGLDDATQFDPAAFDPATVTEALSRLR